MTSGLPPHPGLAGGPVYLDYNATTPVDPRVTEAMAAHLTGLFGNPSSDHPYGAGPRAALADARAQVAALIGARPHEIVFTASGSEADLLALRGALLASGRPRPHVITQATEHPAVLETCRAAGHDLLDAAPQIAAATGSACHSGTRTPSPVLTAMGLDTDRALGALRLSLGRWTTRADIDTAATALIEAAIGTGPGDQQVS